MSKDLAQVAKAKKIEYFLISFVDLYGVMRAKLVPSSAIAQMQKNGAGFAGYAVWLDMTPADPDMFAVPDPDSLIQLPWKPEVAWVAGDLVMSGRPVEQAPRCVLKRQIAAARSLGYRMKTGVECEFFVIRPDGATIADGQDIQSKPCYDQQSLMRRYEFITEICNAKLKLGWGAYQNDHEDANGQFEMNWDYADCMVTADRHAFFKYMAKTLAEAHGLRVTFMPKPFSHLTGNGCHCHVSIWDPAGRKNLFESKTDEMGISKLGYQFLGGLLAHAPAMAALTNPTVNSYKRINAPATSSGATWSPNGISYSGNNRTHMIRIPDPGRFEVRLADGAVNPYLLQSGILAAGLDGISQKRDPGRRLDINMYSEADKAKGVKQLPLYLIDAIRNLDRSRELRRRLGDEFVESYVKLKTREWNEYSRFLTQWEQDVTLDC